MDALEFAPFAPFAQARAVYFKGHRLRPVLFSFLFLSFSFFSFLDHNVLNSDWLPSSIHDYRDLNHLNHLNHLRYDHAHRLDWLTCISPKMEFFFSVALA